MTSRTLILVAGPSGSGKSRLTRLSGLPQLRLDDFYRDEGEEGMPMIEFAGAPIPDWDDPRSWNTDAALEAVRLLMTTGEATIPKYDISQSRAVGTHTVTVNSTALIAEGLFAAEMAKACRKAGIDVLAIWLDRHKTTNFLRRFIRDVKGHRKPVPVLIHRGFELARREQQLRHDALAAGFVPLTMKEATMAVNSYVGV